MKFRSFGNSTSSSIYRTIKLQTLCLSGSRLQFISFEGVSSTHAKVACGVPQGSVLGPLLFLLYINDIANAIPEHKVKLFADDANLFITSRNISLLNPTVNAAILRLYYSIVANRVSLNLEKTCYVVFSSSKENYCIDLKLNEVEIKKS
jgi:Reverse transcriptase (RNA-dependent DNA polymerase)